MKNRFLCVSIFIFLISDLFAQSKLELAKKEYDNLKLINAKRLYQEIWISSGSLNERIASGRQLVNISWKFYNDYDLAKKFTDSLLVLDADNFSVLFQFADISMLAEKFDNTEQYLQESLKKAKNENQVKNAHIKFAEYILSKSQNDLSNHKAINRNKLQEALNNIENYYFEQPENLNISRLYLGLALLTGNNEKVLNAWNTYFRIPQKEQPTGLLAEAEAQITKGFQSKENIELLIRGLALSRFYDYAVMIMLQNNLDYNNTAYLTDIYNYYFFLSDIEGLIYDYYRKKTLGTVSDDEYIKNYYSLCIDFWDKLSWENNKPVFYEKAFEEELFKRFGTKINNGKGGNQIMFFAGHSVINDRCIIEQYNRQAKITYLSLDYIIGNIYPHWYFGFFGVGGWATIDHEIIRIRTVTFNENSPLRAFNRLTNENEREYWMKEIKEKSILDDSMASSNPYEILQALSERMKYQCYNKIIDSLKLLHNNNSELKIHFLYYVNSVLVDASIYNHEGRHILDSYVDYPDNTMMFTSEEREFRANLSGIAFSSDPNLIIAEGTLRREDPAHENANRRIIKGLVDWMEMNKQEIRGLNTTRPLLPQLYLLTNEQIVRAIRSFDPLYVKYVEKE
jgi:hypothetical protein